MTNLSAEGSVAERVRSEASASRRVAVALRREAAPLLAAVALLVALVLPPIDARRAVHRYQLTFDVSQSMAVEDMVSDGVVTSRLEFAKDAASVLLRELPCGSHVGWGAFVERRTVTLVTPLEICAHYDALLAALEGIDARMRWGEASGIGKGLHQALRAADAIGEGTAVVMLSDGQEAPPLEPGQTGLPKDEGLGVRGLLAGVGGDAAVPIPKLDAEGRQVGVWQADEVVQPSELPAGQGQEHLSRLDQAHLTALARLAGLEYARLERREDLLGALRAAELGETAPVPTDFRRIPAALALLALCWRFRPGRPRAALSALSRPRPLRAHHGAHRGA